MVWTPPATGRAQDGGAGRAPAGRRTGRTAERALAIGGAAVGVLGGAGTGIIEAFYAPLRWGAVRLPLAPLLAVASNMLLVWFTYRVTRRTGLAMLPGAAWLVVMGFAMDKRTEGDLLLVAGNWMALVLVIAGSLAWAVAVAVLVWRHALPPARHGSTGMLPPVR